MIMHSLLAAKPDILLVDDNRENLRLLSTMLSDSGYKVRKAINGTLALRALDAVKPDLVLLDIKMKLLYISEGEHELSGLNPQEGMTQPEHLLASILPNSQADLYNALRGSTEPHQQIDREYPIAAPNGEVKWVRNSARYSLMNNGDVMVDGVAIDVSDCLRYSFASGSAAQERVRLLKQAIAQSVPAQPTTASSSNISTSGSTPPHYPDLNF
jgi:CheY-like chemotaxis protein